MKLTGVIIMKEHDLEFFKKFFLIMESCVGRAYDEWI